MQRFLTEKIDDLLSNHITDNFLPLSSETGKKTDQETINQNARQSKQNLEISLTSI